MGCVYFNVWAHKWGEEEQPSSHRYGYNKKKLKFSNGNIHMFTSQNEKQWNKNNENKQMNKQMKILLQWKTTNGHKNVPMALGKAT